MTLLTALSQANTMRPNAADDAIKAAQLYELEGRVAEMFGVDPPANPYDPESDEDYELLMPAPYDEMYRWYLMAMIDLANEETDLYANDMEVFNASWDRAAAWYRRTTRPAPNRNWRVM